MGGSSSNLREKNVVIVGGGYAGTALANNLMGKCKLTLVDPKDCFHHTVGALRASVEKGYAKKTLIPYAPTYGESFKRGAVKSIDASANKIVLETGEDITYDYLIIATGTGGVFPVKLDADVTDASKAIELYNATIEKISAAKDIVIIGGGPVGVELAGEIATDYEGKKITLIHSKPALIDNGNLNEKFRNNVRQGLEKHGVEVLLEQRVSNLDDLPRDGSARCTVKTDQGKEVEADLVFVCIGLKTNSSAYSEAFSSSLDEIQCLKTNEFLQVDGQSNVFAIGDCCNADAQAKMAYKAGLHAEVVAKNLQLLADEKSLKPYKPPVAMMVVPIGRNGGVMQVGSMVLGDWAAKMVKSKAGAMMVVPIGRNGGVMQVGSMVLGDWAAKAVKSKGVFTSKYWGDMKQKMPTN